MIKQPGEEEAIFILVAFILNLGKDAACSKSASMFRNWHHMPCKDMC